MTASISALPAIPSRADPTNFAANGDAFLGALPTFRTEANALAVDANAQAVTATAQAVIATTQAGNAATSAANALASENASAANSTATIWVSGTTYAIGNVRFSPINYFSYRRKTAGAGTTDPSADATNWVLILALPSQTGNAGKALITDGTSPAWGNTGAQDYILQFNGIATPPTMGTSGFGII